MLKRALAAAVLVLAWSAPSGATECLITASPYPAASGTALDISANIPSSGPPPSSISDVNDSSITLDTGVSITSTGNVLLQSAPTTTGGGAPIYVNGNINAGGDILLQGSPIFVTKTANVACSSGWVIAGSISGIAALQLNTAASITQNGATLNLTGTVGDLAINSGHLSVAPGVLSSGPVLFGPSTQFAVQVNGADKTGIAGDPNLYASLVSSGAVDLSNSPTLSFNVSYTPDIGTTYTIISAASVTGTFHLLRDHATFAVNSSWFQIAYTATTVIVTAILPPAGVTIGATPSYPDSGQTVTFTATVTGTSGSTPTGTVTFVIDGDSQAPVTLMPGGQAALSLVLITGVHSIDAQYSGDANNAAANASDTGADLSYTVYAAQITASVIPSPCPDSLFGEGIDLEVDASFENAGIAALFYNVTIDSNSAATNQPILDGTGMFAISSLPSGTHNLRFAIGGTGVDGWTITKFCTVLQASTTTALASSANPSLTGDSVTLTATPSPVAPGAGTPTGTVTFQDGATPIGSPKPLVTGAAQIDTGPLTAGTHALTAIFSGDSNFNGSTSTALMQVVADANADLSTLPDLLLPPDLLTSSDAGTGRDLAGRDLATNASTNDLSVAAPDLSGLRLSGSGAGCACNTTGDARAPWPFLFFFLGFALRRKVARRD